MVKITKDTFQKLLLAELSSEAKKRGDLYIFVESLPLFLSTSIAFKIFNYQLRNFPRKVIWTAQEERVLHLMKLVELPIKEHLTKEEIARLEKESASPKQIEGPQIITNELTIEESSTDIKYKGVSNNLLIKSVTNVTNTSEQDVSKLNLKQLFNSSDYSPSNLIEDENSQSDILSKGKTLQDLDSWIDRIEATKIALNSMKGGDAEELNPKSDKPTSALTNIVSSLPFNSRKKQPQAYLFLTTFFACALVFILAMVFFPSNVYTFEINSPESSNTINLSIPSSQFNKQIFKLNATSTIPTSGDNQTGSERATGKIDIINKSSKSLTLSNGSFSLVKDEKRYIHLRNSTLPELITIPAFNDLSPVSIFVQAEEIGPDYNQPINSGFEILNSLGQKPCSSCQGIASTQIVSGQSTGNKVVTENDQSLLRSNVETLLAQQKVNKLQTFKEERAGIDDVVTNNDWTRNISSSYVFLPDLGVQAADTQLKATVDVEVYNLAKSIFDQLLERENADIEKVTEINILETLGEFSEKPSDIKIKVTYKYTKKIAIDKRDIEQILDNSKNFSTSREEIQRNYDSVISIDKKEIGLKIPFIKPTTNIKYIQNN
jgi:hypothetical protein